MTLQSHKKNYIKEIFFFSILGLVFGSFIFCFIASIPTFYKNMELMTLIKSTFIGGLYGMVIENAHLVGFIPMISIAVLYNLILEEMANKPYNNVLTRISLCFFIGLIVCAVFYNFSPIDFHLLKKDPWKIIVSGSLSAAMVAAFTKSIQNYNSPPKINLNLLFTMLFLIPVGWCALALYMSIYRIHHWFLGFIAANVSKSCTSYASLACDGFYWDSNLQLASYLAYATIFNLFFILTIYFARTKKI